MRKIVVPGEMISDKPLRIQHTIVEEGKTYATVMSTYDEDTRLLTPLEMIWHPTEGEKIIGIIEEAKLNTYSVNLNAPYKGIIISKFIENRMSNGDIIEAIVKEVDRTGTVVLARPRTLFGGKVLYIKPPKIPRVLGKGNSMIRQLGMGTKSSIEVGMNGLVWIRGGDIDLATEAILKIQEEAHIPGLTERINKMLGNPSQSAEVPQ